MYSLREAWFKMNGVEPIPQWDGKMYCNKTDATVTFRANETHGYMAAYTFTLVTDGWLTIVYNGQELTLHPDDLYIYSPGLPITIVTASDDYRGICLLADERVTLDTPSAYDLVHIAYVPIVQLHMPKLTLAHADALRLEEKMSEITGYLHSHHMYKDEVLRMLYAIFLLDLHDAQSRAIPHRTVPQRVEDHFVSFIRLLPQHFAEHHDIAFYADALHISTVYLSRIVRQVAGRTVVDYINQMLLMEATFLLRTTRLSVAQIADRLHFADTPSFIKFFSRLKGITPKKFRDA